MSEPAPAAQLQEPAASGLDQTVATAGQVFRWLLIAGLMLAVVGVTRVSLQSHQQLELARSLQARGDIPAAVLAYRHAAEAWAPFGATGTALDELDELATGCHERNDTVCELMALRAMRSSILSIRTLWVPFGARLGDIHVRIAAGMATQSGSDAEPGERAARYREQLDRWADRSPHRGLALASSVLFVLWLLSFPVWLIQATPQGGAVRWKVFLVGLLLNPALAVAWLLAVYHA